MKSLTDIEIRELNANDTDSFIELKKVGLSTDPSAFVADIEDDAPNYQNNVRNRIKNASISNGDIILGAYDNNLIGIVAVTRHKNKKRRHKADLHGMYLRPEYRGIGLGRELLNRILKMAEKMEGLEEIELVVASNNENVLRLYEKVGFEKTYFERHALQIDNNYVDAYHMKCEIH